MSFSNRHLSFRAPTPARTPQAEESRWAPLARLPEDWTQQLVAWGERPFRAGQIFRWLHRNGVLDASEMTNLPGALRTRLQAAGLTSPARVQTVQRSFDGTRKLLLQLRDGQPVECVLIPMRKDAPDSDQDEEPAGEQATSMRSAGARTQTAATAGGSPPPPPGARMTLCISSQVGCAMGCRFCASGREGLRRGLSADEIIAQVLVASRYLEPGEFLRNLVFMGMGEPLHHYVQTHRALTLLTHPEGLHISPRKITVSTVGLVPGIVKLGRDFGGKIGLAVSLHAPDNATRERIMPMNQSYNLEQLLDALRRYPLAKRRRITIEYTLIAGVNAERMHAERLAQRLRGLRVKVNLIPMNPIEGSPYRAPRPANTEAFYRVLRKARISCSVRQRKGDDVDAACGQLALIRSR